MQASGRVIPAHAALAVAPLAFRAAVLVFHENPVLLAEVEVLEVVAWAGLVPLVESPVFAASNVPDVDDA